MKENNIGYTFWPYKKRDGSCFVGITAPEGWRLVTDFAEAPRNSFKEIREARPNQAAARKALDDFLEAALFRNCTVQESYIRSLQMK